MESPTQTLTTSLSKTEVIIKDWITGADADYIEQALYDNIDVKARGTTPEIGGMQLGILIPEQAKREIEKFVVSVGGSTENVFEAVGNLPEVDRDEVKAAIAERRKKKVVPSES